PRAFARIGQRQMGVGAKLQPPVSAVRPVANVPRLRAAPADAKREPGHQLVPEVFLCPLGRERGHGPRRQPYPRHVVSSPIRAQIRAHRAELGHTTRSIPKHKVAGKRRNGKGFRNDVERGGKRRKLLSTQRAWIGWLEGSIPIVEAIRPQLVASDVPTVTAARETWAEIARQTDAYLNSLTEKSLREDVSW